MRQKENRGTMIFCIALAIYLSSMIFNASMFGIMTVGSRFLKLAKYGAYALMLWKIVMDTEFSSKQVIAYGFCAIEIALIYYCTGDKIWIFIFLMMIAISDVCFSKVLKTYIWTNGLCIGTVIIFRALELIPARNNVRKMSLRYSLGFDFVTTGANLWMYLVLAYICYRRKRITWIEAMILEIITCLFFAFTDTKNAFAITTAAIVLALVLKLWNERSGQYLFSFLIKYTTLIGTAVIGILVFFFDKSTFVSETLNDLLTNRVSLTYNAVQKYGIRLFGQAISWIGGTIYFEKEYVDYNYVDSSYMQLLLSYGIILLAMILVGYCLFGRLVIKERQWYLGLAIVLSAAHSTFDPQLSWVQYNIFFLALGYLFVDKEKRGTYLCG